MDAALAEAKLTAKGIWHAPDRYERSGIKFHVNLLEDGSETQVPVGHDFRSGDRFTFTFEINRDTYVYVVNRTRLEEQKVHDSGYGSDDAWVSKRIVRAEPEGGDSGDPILTAPRLLFPTEAAGLANLLMTDKPYEVPREGYYVMDSEPGTEKLYVVISDRPLNMWEYFRGCKKEKKKSVTT